MNNAPPISEGGLSGTWINWFQQVFSCLPWKKAFNVKATLDFPSIIAQQQSGLTVTVNGARSGDAVIVTPTTDVTGLIFTGAVTAINTVTVYAKNFSGIAVDATSQTFRIIVIQN
jgi:hypothetical protein